MKSHKQDAHSSAPEPAPEPNFMDAVIENVSDAIITIDADQIIVQFNRAAERVFGISCKDAIGKALNDFAPDFLSHQHSAKVDEFARDTIGQSRIVEIDSFVANRADGQKFFAEASVTHFAVAEKRYFTAVIRDVSRRVEAEKQRRQRDELFESLVEGVDEVFSIVKFDPVTGEPTYEYISGQTAKFTGFQPEDFLSDIKLYTDLIHPEDQAMIAGAHLAVKEAKKPMSFVFRMLGVDCTYQTIERRSSPQMDSSGNVVRIFSIARNVTDKVRAEEALKRSEDLYRTLVEGIEEVVCVVGIDSVDLSAHFEFASKQIE